MEEESDDSTTCFLFIFNAYHDKKEDDYTDVALLESDPDYIGQGYLQGGNDSDCMQNQ